ncbi:hypothetical protein ACH5RR_010439 [Cinchona calisaya]|uniref:Cyclin-dependent kinase inhibitor n=1 Tax=Cinchona calisaya TaxID=153742 RepID=A0ABD3AIY3_9GENT
MEVSQGVRTRAKTLALQRLQSSSAAAAAAPTVSHVSDSSCYLQLRSRRLQKPSLLKPQSQQKPSSKKESLQPESQTKPNPSRSRATDSVHSGSAGSGPNNPSKNDENRVAEDLGVEASFGENNLDFEPRERSTRESTPCSLIRDVDVPTPGSSTRQTTVNAINRRTRSAILGDIPSTTEIEEFFARAEQQQRQQFIENIAFEDREIERETGNRKFFKYIKKPEVSVGVAVKEVSQSNLGVRTRAKTLTLQQQLNSNSVNCLRLLRLSPTPYTAASEALAFKATSPETHSELPTRIGNKT